jgi:hypothetical protein
MISPRHVSFLDLINGNWVAHVCYVTARLWIADLLAAGPRSAD